MKKRFITALCTLLLSFTALQLNAQIAFSLTDEESEQNTPDGWTAVSLPVIPTITSSNTFDITTYGASTSSADNTTAIQAALDAAASAGGGMVVVPAGTYLTSYLQMGSKTVLHLSAGATLKMKAITTFGIDDNGYHTMTAPLITGKSGASDIVIEGESRTTSIIDGQGAPWWDEVEAAKEAGKSTTRQALIRFWQGSRYLFRNFRIQNAPNTNICIGRSGNGSHATAHDITIKNPASHDVADPSHNTDGFPIWTQYVNIYDCEIDTGDDNVVTDSGAQFVHVWNCNLKAGHGASLGSYTVDMHDILYEDLTFTGTDCGFRLKSNRDRSGDVYNITFRNCTMTNVMNPIQITAWYDTLPSSPEAAAANPDELISTTPQFRDILIKDVTVTGYTGSTTNPKNGYGIFIYGRPESKVKDVTFDNVNITHSKGMKLDFCQGIKFLECSYTDSKTSKSTSTYNVSELIAEQYECSYKWLGNKYAVPSEFTPTDNQEVEATAYVNLTYGADGSWKKSTGDNSVTGYSYSVSGINNPKNGSTNYSTSNKLLPNVGTYYIFSPTVDGTIKAAIVLNADKDFYIVKGSNGEAFSPSDVPLSNNSGAVAYNSASGKNYQVAAKLYGSCEFDVEAGETYYMFCNGSKLGFYGFEFTKASTKPAGTITFASTSGSADIAEGTSYTLPAITTTPANATLTYSSSVESVATVNATTGAVTLVGVGTTTITASFAGDEDYSAAQATFELTVTNSTSPEYTNTWQFGKSNGAEEFALQKSAEYTYTVNGHSLTINTDAGKLNNASRSDQWAQCNNGTLFKVPTFEGAKLTWGRYNTGGTTGFTIGGQLYNEYYIATAEGTTNMTATGISYLSFIKVEPVTMYEITGTISGGDINSKSIIFTADGNGETYTATIAEGAFTLKVPADTYTLALGDDVAYVISTPESVTVSEAGSIGAITIVAATPQTVTGAITNAPAEAFTLTFTGGSHTESVTCDANATSYSITLDPDTYVISSNVGTLSTLSVASFKVVKDAVTHNIYFPETIPAATSANITVDNNAVVAANVYHSVSDALAAAKAGNISSPVITLTSGQTYKEQVIVDMANVTLKTSGAEKATITWYYGIGYSYYSLNDKGYYDKDRAMTRNEKLEVGPGRWGATVLVTKNGNNFKAENIIFENSFNQRYTTEEVEDGVEYNLLGDAKITYDRTLQPSDPGYKAADSKAATERAAAIAFENNPTGCELYNCEFLSSQDTFYSSGNIYVKRCSIMGNTDYIFGGGNVVFDDCDLVIGGYSDQEASAYITANSAGANEYYIFRDCTVKPSARTYIKSNLGRDWGGVNTHVYFFNLKNEIGNKLEYKWNNMGGGVTAGTADLHIYDFDPTINANYATTGASGANINGLVSDADALTLYSEIVDRLGFTPTHIYDDNVALGESSAYNVCRIAASDGAERTVELTRGITADKWSTIVLPFALSSEQITTAFGAGTQVAELASSTETGLTFNTVTAMTANRPYAIKVSIDFAGATINGVTIAKATPEQTVGNWVFNGTYTSQTAPVDSYVFSGNKLRKVTDNNVTVKPFRAYITYNGVAPANELEFILDGETTGVETVYGLPFTVDSYYDLQGRRVAQPTKGVYIVNGRKTIVK